MPAGGEPSQNGNTKQNTTSRAVSQAAPPNNRAGPSSTATTTTTITNQHRAGRAEQQHTPAGTRHGQRRHQPPRHRARKQGGGAQKPTKRPETTSKHTPRRYRHQPPTGQAREQGGLVPIAGQLLNNHKRLHEGAHSRQPQTPPTPIKSSGDRRPEAAVGPSNQKPNITWIAFKHKSRNKPNQGNPRHDQGNMKRNGRTLIALILRGHHVL